MTIKAENIFKLNDSDLQHYKLHLIGKLYAEDLQGGLSPKS